MRASRGEFPSLGNSFILYLLTHSKDTPILALCRLLIAGTKSSDLQQIVNILESTGGDLLLTSSYLSNSTLTGEHTEMLVTKYLNATGSHWRSWSVSTLLMGEGRQKAEGGRCRVDMLKG